MIKFASLFSVSNKGSHSFSWFIQSLIVFCICAFFAFYRNIAGLFYHFDGAYALVNAQNRFNYFTDKFSISNNVFQSISNIQMGMNDWLFYFMWPAASAMEPSLVKVGVYVLVGASFFVIAYLLARNLSFDTIESIAAGWLLAVIATPFVPRPFFYEILASAPQFCVIAIWPVLASFLIRPIGRAGYWIDAVCTVALFAIGWWLLAAGPMFAPLVIPGFMLYLAIQLTMSKTRSELFRKLSALALVVVVVVALRWPWYLYGLFAYTAPYLFPSDFSVVYNSPVHVSVLFHKNVFGLAGPLLASTALLGAILSLRSLHRPRRIAAWAMLGFVGMLLTMLLVIVNSFSWILPPPLYFEIAIWPLYAVFAAVLMVNLTRYLLRKVPSLQRAVHALPCLHVALPIFLVSVLLAISSAPGVQGYLYPPRSNPMVDTLREKIAFQSDDLFRGRVATFTMPDPAGGDPWNYQFSQGQALTRAIGNDLSTLGLWYYRIPTLMEYNQFSSPAFHRLVKRSLQVPPIRHQRNITILTTPDVRVLELLGVGYVISPSPLPATGTELLSESVSGTKWRLFQLAAPNIHGYSPTELDIRADFSSMLDFVLDERVDLTKRAIVQTKIAETLKPATTTTLTITGGDLHVRAQSAGQSLIVVPFEYSHCLVVRSTSATSDLMKPTLHRVNGLLTGILFDKDLDIYIEFRTSPLRNVTCRFDDYLEFKAINKQTLK